MANKGKGVNKLLATSRRNVPIRVAGGCPNKSVFGPIHCGFDARGAGHKVLGCPYQQRLSTNAKKVTVSVLYWYKSFPAHNRATISKKKEFFRKEEFFNKEREGERPRPSHH
jgi:hypothetical protein